MTKELNELVWCSGCADKDPPHITKTEYIIPARGLPYELAPDGLNIDDRVVGVCGACLVGKSKFHQERGREVGANYPHLIYKKVQ